jgi:hypothetical protein
MGYITPLIFLNNILLMDLIQYICPRVNQTQNVCIVDGFASVQPEELGGSRR